ncbi:structure-specific endonuclease subunit SLX4 [Nematolebias whitei]|uniref:structure-specific endonuclease subunit SLX4 n=1 Tax=Nematolebias whitei TaxID=451745 RepID=UPI00189BF1E2|nr:structure-specific endonuclease subunit SLX4 [Nematolebias whitei]
MDDSDQDFVDIYSKLLKRARKKAAEPTRQTKKPEQALSQVQGDKRRNHEQVAASQPVGKAEQEEVRGGTRFDPGEPSAVPSDHGAQSDRDLRAKDKVLLKMQHFKRVSPQKMVHNIHVTKQDTCALTALHQIQDPPASLHSALHADSDEALALQLQQQLDREAAEAQTVDLEDGGLFFCQICHRDLSHMTPEGRTQHLNRCLDESENSGPATPPASAVPDCPICGKKFKSQKSREAHLKRCSADMGVSAAMLLQALQRQAQESQSAATANTRLQSEVKKRKDPPKSGVPARKKPRKKFEPLDEKTMVALALSRSMAEQEKELHKEKEAEKHLQTECVPPHSSVDPMLKWSLDTAKGRGKKRKGTVPRPPPLLLVQDAEAALTRIQERVSALLLRSLSPAPPTPTRSPSSLPRWTGAALLWEKSALLDGDATCLSDFYSAELKQFFTLLESVQADAAPSTTNNKPECFVQLVDEGTPVSAQRTSVLPTCSQMTSCSSASSTPGAGQLPVGSQALRDLMDLAEDGMTLTQYGYTAKETLLSDFIQEKSERRAELGVSGFLLETTHKPSDDPQRRERTTNQPEADAERSSYRPVALSRLVSDVSSMVNNPQLSDVQLQVDSGQVFFAHSFMVYARCPLLAEMVHESGIGVKEEDVPAAQRVLLSDVPGQAVFALLQYLYTAHCSVPAALQPHMLELASRFDLQELEQLCHLQQEAEDVGDDVLHMNQEETAANQTDQAFMELLRSMWSGEDEDVTNPDGGGRLEETERSHEVTSGDRELGEERVNEEELEEIYEFAATQKQKKEEDSEEEEEDEDQSGDVVFTKLTEPQHGRGDKYLFSESWGVYEGDRSSGTPKTHPVPSKHQTPWKPSSRQSATTLLQSSESLEDLSVCPPLVTSNLPITGLSPGPGGDQEDGEPTRRDAVESQVPTKLESLVPPPESPLKKEEPELIVLSDSSEEMDVAVAVLHPCRLSSTQNQQSYTELRSRPDPTPSEDKESRNLEPSPDDPRDCSPEVSWLIPSTPLQSHRSSRSSSSQTKSSMYRTQLFPKGESSPPSSSVFFSPASLTFNNELHASNKPQVPARATARLKPSASPPRSFDGKARLRKTDASQNKDVSAVSSSRFSLPVVSKQETPSGLQPPPYSSTPAHAQPPVPPPPPLHTHPEKREIMEKTELESDPPSSSSFSEFHQSESSSPSRGSAESSSRDCPRDDLEKNEQEEQEQDCSDQGVVDAGELSFQQSFVDEPPIAFNDSWGLDVCAETDPGGVSPRLDDGGGSSLQDGSRRQTSRTSSSSISSSTLNDRVQMNAKRGGATSCPPQSRTPQLLHPPPPEPSTRSTPEGDNGVLDSKLWDSWEEDEEVESLPLCQRVTAQLKTPELRNKKRRSVVPITPMPQFSDMDTPELKNKLNRFGVRPLPKRQMVLKLKEIHQYTHQLTSSDSEDEAPQMKPPSSRLVSCAQMAKFKEPQAPAVVSPVKSDHKEEAELLSASQGSNASSTAASEESERSNPEQVLSSDGDSDSDGGISSSQAVSRLQAVRSFILSDPKLYNQILQYQPLVLAQFQAQLKAAGIRLGAAKLMDYLDSQCITFTTAKPGHSAASRGRRGQKRSKGTRAASRKNDAVKL